MKDDEVADLELIIHRSDEQSCSVDFRFTDGAPRNQVEVRLGAGEQALAAFDFQKLGESLHLLDLLGYGQVLTAGLFADERLRVAYAQARARARLLRVRLSIHPSALELHRL